MKLFLSPPDESFGYSFNYGSAHFVCLDMSAEAEDIQWADEDLAASRAKWKIPFYHYPNFNIGGHGSARGRDTLVPMFRKHKVDLAISGHSHLYERFYPLVPINEPDAHPITYVVSGGGGAPTYGSQPNPALASYAAKQHFMVIQVTPDALIIETRDIDGNLFDSCTIRKVDGAYDEDYLASTKPEEAVTLHGGFGNRDLKFRLSGLPSTNKDVTVKVTYPGRSLPFPAKVTIGLDEGSAKRYSITPSSVEIDVATGKPLDATFTLRAKQKVGYNEKGGLGPVLTFERRHEVGNLKWSVPKTLTFDKMINAADGWDVIGKPEPAERIWSYTSFDPLTEKDALDRGSRKRFRNVTLPEGFENWTAPDFDTAEWKTGKAPIGVGEFRARGAESFKNESEWGKGEFLLMRTTFALEDTDYDFLRIRALAKQGYHIYLNGHKVHTYTWWNDPKYREILLGPEHTKHLVKGTNVLAAYCNLAYGNGKPVGQADFYLEGIKWK